MKIRYFLLVFCLLLPTAAADVTEIFIPEFDRSFSFDNYRVVEAPDDIEPSSLNPADFGIGIAVSRPSDSYLLMRDTPAQTPVVVLDSGIPGPVIYLVAGTHGDERAGWLAASLLESLRVDRGCLYLLSRANMPGTEHLTREMPGGLNLNRAYPGSREGNLARQTAFEIFSDIKRVSPALVLDLHEAAALSPAGDFLGNKLIYTSLDGMEDLFFSLLTASEEGSLGTFPFGFVSPGVAGSLNYTLPNELGIPVITTETFRGFPLSHRVRDQVDIALFCLRSYSMIDH